MQEGLHIVELIRGEVAACEDGPVEDLNERATVLSDPHRPRDGADAGYLVNARPPLIAPPCESKCRIEDSCSDLAVLCISQVIPE